MKPFNILKTLLTFSIISSQPLIAMANTPVGESAKPVDLRLYRLDGGAMHMGDMSRMSDEGKYKGRSLDIVMSCYLIKHGDVWMLWDAGYPTSYLGGKKLDDMDMQMSQTLVQQLQQIGLKLRDISIVAISHAHFDHTGQVDDFADATLYLQKAELDVLSDEAACKAHFIEPGQLQKHLKGASAKYSTIDGDHDFFGDGTVKAFALPGHTPGHMALEIRLRKGGNLILSGDQWHFTENRKNKQVPVYNFDHAQTMDSTRKLEQIISRDKARLIIQHQVADNKSLPAFPKYLD